jgi:hypothetical protein
MKTIKIVCHLGISMDCLVNFNPISQITKHILATGAISSPKTAIKLAKKSGSLNHFTNIIIKDSIKKTLQIMAKRAINAKKDLLNRLLMIMNKIQDKKITQKAFLVVGLSL